ncbi:MAG: efflux RND transporter periplasmic adaptor subunit [Paramuribaculum sp.]|nr:efflux RND transporter periplasmic adaptor subunit [Paramuribaculum sp.]
MKVSVMNVAAAVISGATLITMCSCGGGQQQQQMPAPQIATMTLSLNNSQVENSYPATIKGKTDIDIRPQVTGFITKVHVDEGQRVHKGQVLFTLDQVQFQAAVDQAQAAVNAAQTSVNTAKMTADTKKRLLDKNIISQYEYQVADNNLQSALAQLAQAQASLTTARKNLAYTVVTAPSDGMVGTIPNREGSLASPSSAQPLTTISDNSQVYAYFSLTEKDLLNLTNNGSRTLQAAIDSMPAVKLRLADGTIFPIEGKVATVSGVIDNSTGSASVRALFNNDNGMLRSGSTGAVLIPDTKSDVIVIPQKATFELQDRRYAYIVTDSNVVKTAPITVDANTDGRNFVVTSGLKAGDRIAIEGVGTTLKDGITITPVSPEQAAAAQAQQQQAAAARK